MVIVSAIVCIYYNVIVAWTIYYLFMSFRAVLPWSHCQNTWNTENCVDSFGDTLNKTAINATTGNSSKLTTASEEFWEYVFFQFYLFLLHCSLKLLCNLDNIINIYFIEKMQQNIIWKTTNTTLWEQFQNLKE